MSAMPSHKFSFQSVVSATADPDTFVLEKRAHSDPRLVSSQIGSKTLRTVLLEEGGTKDVTGVPDGGSKACLDENQISKLARAALAVEKHYASQRDTEWAFAGEQLYMLQARPVTSAHVLDTDFEFYHEGDEGLVSEYDCFTKANVGEVFGGSTTPLTLDTTFRTFMRRFKVKHEVYSVFSLGFPLNICSRLGIELIEIFRYSKLS